MKRQDFENALNELDILLSNENLDEKYYQEWFETYEIAFHALGFKKIIPHGVLKKDKGRDIPDFLVQSVDDIWYIFEIKRPDTQVLKSQKKRKNFYNTFRDYVSQCYEYSEYFDESSNREKFNQKYNVNVHKNLKSIIVAGRNNGIDKTEIHNILYREGAKIELLTYDDIRNRIEFYRTSLFSKYEKLNGFSVNFLLKIFRIRKKQNYIFDLGCVSNKNRISGFIDSNDYLTLRVIDNHGNKYLTKIKEKKFGFYYGQECFICFDVGIGEEHTIISLEVNGQYFKDINLDTIDFDFDYINQVNEKNEKFNNITIGSDVDEKELSNIHLGEILIYSKTMSFQDKSQLRNYFLFNTEKRKFRPVVGMEHFRLVKDVTK